MDSLTIISATIGLSILFVFFLQLFNSNFLKERKSILDRLGIYQQYSTALPKDVELRDNGLKQDAKRYHTAWHRWKLFLYIVGAGFITFIIYLAFNTTGITSLLIGLLSGSFMWGPGDMFLNKTMGWPWNERGDNSGMDWFSFPVRFGLLLVAILLIFVSCTETNTPIKGTNIDFIPENSRIAIDTITYSSTWDSAFNSNPSGIGMFYITNNGNIKYVRTFESMILYMENNNLSLLPVGSMQTRKVYMLTYTGIEK